MKLAEYDGQVEQSGGLKSRQYKIATNRKSFEVLSKSLYSDRIGAVIRELSTNAADANTAAEMKGGWTSKPFIVHLPNTMEPFFAVEDFGTGMTDSEIDELYTTYFGSNRNTSNRFTGALGLGSKSPFTYGDQFTVVSTVDGERRTYTCYITEEGLPDVAPMPIGTDDDGNNVFIENVKAPNGVLVKVPVETKDIKEFEEKAANILRWFNPRPEVVGSADYQWRDEKYLIKTDIFGMPKDRRDRSYVIMGNVAYQLIAYDITGLASHEQSLLQWGVDIWMDIGDVEIAANREKLTYTPDTIKTIKAQLKKIAQHMRDEAAKFLDRAKTIWEARRMIFDYKKGVMGSFIEGSKLQWNGQTISTCVYFNRYSRSPVMCELAYKGRVHKDKNYPVLRKNPTDHVEADGSPIFIEDCHGGQKKIAYHMSVKGIDKAYILSTTRQIVKSAKDVDNGDDDDDVKGNPDIDTSGLYETAVLASTLPDVPKMPRKPGADNRGNYTRLMRYKPKANGDSINFWDNAKVDINDGGVYVVMCRFNIIKGGRKDLPKEQAWDRTARAPSSCSEALACLETLEEDELEVFGIRPAEEGRLTKVGGWQTLKSYIKDFLKENSEDYLPRVVKSLQFAKIEACRGFLKLKRDEFDDNSPFGQFWDAVFEAKKENENKEVKAFVLLSSWNNTPVDEQIKAAQKDKLDKAYGKLREVYPLLKLVSPSSIDTKTAGHLTEYIQLLDGNRKAGAFKEIFDAEEATA